MKYRIQIIGEGTSGGFNLGIDDQVTRRIPVESNPIQLLNIINEVAHGFSLSVSEESLKPKGPKHWDIETKHRIWIDGRSGVGGMCLTGPDAMLMISLDGE